MERAMSPFYWTICEALREAKKQDVHSAITSPVGSVDRPVMLPAFQDAAKGRWFWKDEYGTSLLGDIRWLRSLKRKRIFGFLALPR